MTEPTVITEPGIYPDLSLDDYHGDPVPGGSLSSTGAKKLLPPSCPALFRYEQDNPPAPKKVFDLGHAAHDTVLGGGPEIVVVAGERWDTTKAKAEVAEVRARGAVPLKQAEMDVVTDMAAALRAHPFAGRLFAPGSGVPEASLFWRDERTEVMRRARLDWLPSVKYRGRTVVADLKTARKAEPTEWAKSAADYGYHQQAAWYCDAVRALDVDDDPLFVFVIQEKTAPYLVTVAQLDINAMRIGDLLNRRALDTYAECTRTDVWPGYVDDVTLASLPVWYERRYEEDIA